MVLLPTALFSISLHPREVLIDTVLALYVLSLLVLLVIASQGFILLSLQKRARTVVSAGHSIRDAIPVVTVQLPVYNELHVVERLIRAVCAIDHPREHLEIQVLDDSTDETSRIIAGLVEEYRPLGFDIRHLRRADRSGYKAGALREGLASARGEYIAIFDADFVPRRDFLKDTLPLFAEDSVAMVQTRWEHLNESYSPLTRVQAFAFDGHFAMDQRVRSESGHFLTFNGTGGIWRRCAIEDAGGWQDDTLTEDLDLSYRAQLRGWRLIFLQDVTSPAELPADFNAFRSQQFRWTKGYIETARKVLPSVWRSTLPIDRKVLSTLHLSGNAGFPFMLLVAVLNVPLAAIKATGGYETFFLLLSFFVLGFFSTLLFYLQAQRLLHVHWLRRMLYYPVFLAGSMGLAVSNTVAVIEGLFGKRSTFERTPKFGVHGRSDVWAGKSYASERSAKLVLAEILLALYCFFGVVFSLYQLDFLAVPFQLLFATGFSLVAWLSLKHARAVRRSRSTTDRP